MTESFERATVDVSVDTVIRSPPAVVAAYANDPSNAPEWYANIISVDWVTAPPVQLGSEVAFVARFLGRRLRYTYRVVEYTPTSFVMRTAQGPFPMETTYQYETTAQGHTRMTLRNRGTAHGFSRVISPLMKPAMRRANRKDLHALKSRLET
jgi:hypothetical protein